MAAVQVKPTLTKVGRVQSEYGGSPSDYGGGTTVTEEVHTEPDGSTTRVVRTIKRSVTLQPVSTERTVHRVVTQTSGPVEEAPQQRAPQRRAPQQRTPQRKAPEDSVRVPQQRAQRATQQRAPQQQAGPQQRPRPINRPTDLDAKPTKSSLKSRPSKTENPPTQRAPLAASQSMDIPFADEVSADLDVPFDLVPSSHNTPSLIRASSVKKRQKQYSVTEVADEFAPAQKSPIQKVVMDPKPQEAWAQPAPKISRARPHSYHGTSPHHRNGPSADSSFQDEIDGDVFSFEYNPAQYSSYGSSDFSLPTESLLQDYKYDDTGDVTPRITISRHEPRVSSMTNLTSTRYRQNANKSASLNRAASMQLRAYKNKPMARHASLGDEWMDEKPKSGSQRRREQFWTTKRLSFKSCDRCQETSHVRTESKLKFDEFHDHFFHTQWPSQTIMICELRFRPSDKIVKFRVTSCNRFSASEIDDSGTHAEVFFSEFLHDKVMPNLLGGEVEKLEIHVWMNNSPCNQQQNHCAERMLHSFEKIEKVVEEAKMSIAFCHLSHLQETESEHIRQANLQGLVLLMANPNITIRQFTGYDWMELLMVRTDNAEKWLRLNNQDLRELITERYEKDAKNRQSLKELIYDYRTAMAEDIGHAKRAMARINVI